MDRNDRAVTAFAMLGHAMFHTYELVIPIFVVIWLERFSTTAAFLGTVVGASYALIGVGALPSGLLADRVSSKRLILACLLGMGAAFALVAVAPSVAVLAVGLLLWGAAASLYHPAGLALLSRGTKARGTAFAYHGAAGNVGVATGPLLAAVMLAFVGWRTVAALLLVPVVLAAAVGWRLEFDETAGSAARDADGTATEREQPRSLAAFVASSRRLFTVGFTLVFATGILYGVYYRATFTFLPEILADLSLFDPVALGGRSFEPSQYVYSGLLLVGGVGQYVGGKLVDRARLETVLLGGYAALAAVALAFVPSTNAGLAPLLVVGGALGFLTFMIAPINQEAISAYTPADARGLSFGYSYTAIFGVGAVGSSLAGFVLTRSTPTVLFVVVAACAAVAALIGGTLRRRSGRRSPDGVTADD
ncbi:major facilitator superfamily MFS 1 [Natrinema pellirubrum DSM 15624]|uniref:Arabinose efflux permease family protein n=1 Tax=Natrinema pellirubrum (strain DSM 15624 / CIP 106293 / JCM 10476 / NCIMB 786 / 157) TaxID=797303 RepID=L0JKK6_NATP1|nr:MFS transporter [Natrinema pellirubrum]AGB30886.1 arabinose efflux permease family protein [Natrinema pellirubrum DSM 15624]ELY80726.1 major facilitator superfamily MFS 1 [Natrinema pellirubrum DSM 15624]